MVTRLVIRTDEKRKNQGEERLGKERRARERGLMEERRCEEKRKSEEQERFHKQEEERQRLSEEYHRHATEVQKGKKKEKRGTIWVQSKQIIHIKTTLLNKTQKNFIGFGKRKEIVNKFVDIEISNPVEIRENSIGMKFALIPAGEFMMGSEERDYEKPVHRVRISKPFYLGIYPVTQSEWKKVMGSNPSEFKGDKLPVENVSWSDIQEFIKNLNEKEGTNKYRLPSEAEWEYAVRTGTTTRYWFGDIESKLDDYAWYDKNSGRKIHDVGQKKPNPWGLYDTYGNVWEWVQDKWHDNYNGAPTDGSSWEDMGGSVRVFRGGCCYHLAEYCRSANRDGIDQDDRDNVLGFRLLRIS